jgi:16S rRNA (uracil1498-N3)-methyltransferase
MTRRRWIADETSGNRAALVGAHADHLVRVLRVRTGQEFDIACGSEVRRGRVCAIEDGRVEFELGDVVVLTVAGLALTLALAVFKFDRMEWAIEKCTELGVERIVPVIAQRSDAHLAAAAGKRVERWQRIAREAAEQSRRDAPPQIASPVKVKEAVVLPGSTRILLAESEAQRRLKEVVADHPQGEGIVLAIGPEGGWTEKERKQFMEAGWIAASMGGTILRAETAAIAAVVIVAAAEH